MRPGITLFPSRRRLLAYGATCLAGGASYVHGATLERHWIEVTRRRLEICLGPAAPSRIRVALLTDFHYDPLYEGDFFERIVAATNAERPDLILLLGDYISVDGGAAPELLSILGKLRAPGGVKAVLGNHDCWTGRRTIIAQVESHGIELLCNDVIRLQSGDGMLTLAGLDSVWMGQPDPRILSGLRAEERVLLAHHEPDYIDEIRPEWRDKVALQVSGHTHGGQICAPGGVVLRKVSYGEKYSRGLYQISPQTQLYVSRGLGTVAIHARLFCRPEIAILDLINKRSD
jgi:hypothetical protein